MTFASCNSLRFIILTAQCFFLTLPCQAQPAAAPFRPEVHFKGIYEFGYMGLRFGKMGIEAEQTPGFSRATSDVTSTGLINLFTRHTSHTTVEATGADFGYPHLTYETHYQTKKRPRHVKLVYDNGKITEEEVAPPEDPAKRPPVPAVLKGAAYDPLSFALAIRRELYQAHQRGQTHFSMNVYDGRRLTEADFTILGPQTLRYSGAPLPVIEVEAHRKLVTGFTKEELADFDPKEPALHIYFTDDERQIPVRLEARVMLGLLTATLIKECDEHESCLLGNKE